jgi:hypothetical protein
MEDQANRERILNENADRMHQQQERDELESHITRTGASELLFANLRALR